MDTGANAARNPGLAHSRHCCCNSPSILLSTICIKMVPRALDVPLHVKYIQNLDLVRSLPES